MNLDINNKFIDRTPLIVWIKKFSDQKKLYQYGNVAYASKKMRYVYIYVETDNLVEIEANLKKADFVKKVAVSKIPELDFSAEQADQTLTKLKEEALQINGVDEADSL